MDDGLERRKTNGNGNGNGGDVVKDHWIHGAELELHNLPRLSFTVGLENPYTTSHIEK